MSQKKIKIPAVSIPSTAKLFYFFNSMRRLQNAEEFEMLKGLPVVKVFPGKLLEKSQ